MTLRQSREIEPLLGRGNISARDRARLLTILSRYNVTIEEEMSAAIGRSNLPLYGMMRYHLGWTDERFSAISSQGGKKLRPTLLLLACEAVGGDWTRAVPAAAAVELLHNFSLVHDDIQDESPLRRHRATVWRLWGEAQAINVGDAMHIVAEETLLRLADKGFDAHHVLKAASQFHRASIALTEGQYLDMSFERRTDVDVAAYLRMIGHKTAALIACATGLGAFLGGAPGSVVACCRRFGEKLGMAFQVRDDYLGIWGNQEETGKSALSDIMSRKKSLPVVYALEKATGEERENLLSYYGSDDVLPEAVPEIMRVLDALGAASYVEQVAEGFYGEALAELNCLALTTMSGRGEVPSRLPEETKGRLAALEALSFLAGYLVYRDS